MNESKESSSTVLIVVLVVLVMGLISLCVCGLFGGLTWFLLQEPALRQPPMPPQPIREPAMPPQPMPPAVPAAPEEGDKEQAEPEQSKG
jgi:hypothetical protein